MIHPSPEDLEEYRREDARDKGIAHLEERRRREPPIGEPCETAPVSIRLREDSRNPAHVQVSVFVGRNEGGRGHAGQITMRVDEWEELVERLDAPEDVYMCQPSWLLRVEP